MTRLEGEQAYQYVRDIRLTSERGLNDRYEPHNLNDIHTLMILGEAHLIMEVGRAVTIASHGFPILSEIMQSARRSIEIYDDQKTEKKSVAAQLLTDVSQCDATALAEHAQSRANALYKPNRQFRELVEKGLTNTPKSRERIWHSILRWEEKKPIDMSDIIGLSESIGVLLINSWDIYPLKNGEYQGFASTGYKYVPQKTPFILVFHPKEAPEYSKKKPVFTLTAGEIVPDWTKPRKSAPHVIKTNTEHARQHPLQTLIGTIEPTDALNRILRELDVSDPGTKNKTAIEALTMVSRRLYDIHVLFANPHREQSPEEAQALQIRMAEAVRHLDFLAPPFRDQIKSAIGEVLKREITKINSK